MSKDNEAVAQVYWVKCSDGGCVAMSEDRLEVLLSCMPTLRFLLLGHPRMKAKEIKELQDGTKILEIPVDLCVSQQAFVLLVSCLLEAQPLPPRTAHNGGGDQMALLTHAMEVLGGCEVLEERLQDHHANPLTPQEDTNSEYVWQILHQSRTVHIDMHAMAKLCQWRI